LGARRVESLVAHPQKQSVGEFGWWLRSAVGFLQLP
jgi:hypothetical protein